MGCAGLLSVAENIQILVFVALQLVLRFDFLFVFLNFGLLYLGFLLLQFFPIMLRLRISGVRARTTPRPGVRL